MRVRSQSGARHLVDRVEDVSRLLGRHVRDAEHVHKKTKLHVPGSDIPIMMQRCDTGSAV